MEFMRTKAICEISGLFAKQMFGRWRKIFRGEYGSGSVLTIFRSSFLTIFATLMYPILTIVSVIEDLFWSLFASEERNENIRLKLDAFMESIRGL